MRFDARIDQAEGLRRLLVRNRTRVVMLLAGKRGVGRSSTAINLASALAKLGKDVLVIDENGLPDNIPERIGLSARHDLIDIVQRRCSPVDALQSRHGFAVLPAARALQTAAKMNQADRQRFADVLSDVGSGSDVILVNASMPMLTSGGHGVCLPSGDLTGATLLVVMDATVSGITDSYALIKRLALECACTEFEIVVNRAADQRDAQRIFSNMAKVAWRKLSVRLGYLGSIPRDERFKRAALLGKPVGIAFPNAISAEAFRNIAQGLDNLPVCQRESGNGQAEFVQGGMDRMIRSDGQYCKKAALAVNS